MASVITTTAQTPITLEVVMEEVQNYVNKSAPLYGRFGDGVGEDINPRGAFVAGELAPNGVFGGGAEGLIFVDAGGRLLQRMTITFLRHDMATSFTEDALETNVKILQNPLPANMQSDAAQFARQNNIMMYSKGSTPRAVVLSVSTATVTFTSPEGTKKIFIGGKYEFRSTGGALRGGVTYYVCTAITATTATFNATIDAAVLATDGIFYKGLFGLEFHGLPYHVDSSVSGTYQGIDRSTVTPQFLPKTEDQVGHALSVQAMERNKAALLNKRGATAILPTCYWWSNGSQFTAFKNLGQSMGANSSSLKRFAEGDKTFDPQFTGVEFSGEVWHQDVDCPETDLYRLHDGYLKKFSFKKLDLYRRGADEQGLWPVPCFDNTGAGNWSNRAMMLWIQKQDMGCVDPAIAIRMFNLDTTSLPTYATS